MSTLTVTTINTANGTTDLGLSTGNTTTGAKLTMLASGGVVFQSNSTTNALSVAANGQLNTVGAMTVNGAFSINGACIDTAGNIRETPISSQTVAYTLVSSDSGKLISTTNNISVPASVFTNGQNISIYNSSSANISISNAAGVTMYYAGTSNTSNRTLFQKGIATIVCVAANTFVVSGAGLL